MQVAIVTAYEVRRALRCSSIEARALTLEGQRRRCRAVGLLLMRTGIHSPTLARFRGGI